MKKIILLLLLSIGIAVAATGDFTIKGTTPTSRADNTPISLSEIAGFNIYCGTTKGDYSGSTFFHKGATLPDTTMVINGLPPGTHYCVATTLDTAGRESIYSNEVTLINNGKARPKPPQIIPGQIITINTTTQ